MELLAKDYVIIDREDRPGSKIFRFTPAICVTKSGRMIFANELRSKGHPGSRPDTPHYDQIKPNPHGGADHVGQIFISDDKGRSWRFVCARNFSQQRIFETGGKLWLLGHSDDLVIYCSEDNGQTWDEGSWLTQGQHWHQSACGMWIEDGYVNLVMERRIQKEGEIRSGWDVAGLAPVMLRARQTDDLRKRENWTFSDEVRFRDLIDEDALEWFGVPFYPSRLHPELGENGQYLQMQCGWLESNLVRITDPRHYWYDPSGKTFHIFMRTHLAVSGYCAVMKAVVEADGIRILPQENPSGRKAVFVPMPGGHNRFHILWDAETRLYWLVSVQSVDSMTRKELLGKDRYNIPNDERHRLQLHFSKNLVDWCFAGMLWVGPTEKHAVHYTSVAVDGDDLVFVSRTSDADADSAHNSNMSTFHRVRNFRKLVY